jgi:hypothetical protein
LTLDPAILTDEFLLRAQSSTNEKADAECAGVLHRTPDDRSRIPATRSRTLGWPSAKGTWCRRARQAAGQQRDRCTNSEKTGVCARTPAHPLLAKAAPRCLPSSPLPARLRRLALPRRGWTCRCPPVVIAAAPPRMDAGVQPHFRVRMSPRGCPLSQVDISVTFAFALLDETKWPLIVHSVLLPKRF